MKTDGPDLHAVVNLTLHDVAQDLEVNNGAEVVGIGEEDVFLPLQERTAQLLA